MIKDNKVEPKNGVHQKMDNSSKLDTIKQLIFGENIEQYNSEFQLLKNEINRSKQELEDLILEFKKELSATLNNTNTDLNIRVTDLESDVSKKLNALNDKKLDRKQMGKLLISIGEKISQ